MTELTKFRIRPHYGTLITQVSYRVAIRQYEDWFKDTAKKLQYIVNLLSEPSRFETEFGKGRRSLAKEILEVIR